MDSKRTWNEAPSAPELRLDAPPSTIQCQPRRADLHRGRPTPSTQSSEAMSVCRQVERSLPAVAHARTSDGEAARASSSCSWASSPDRRPDSPGAPPIIKHRRC